VLKQKIETSKLAELEYHGSSGITKHCLDAITRLIQFGDRIENAWLLSTPKEEGGCRDHAFILTINNGQLIVIGTGFRSGYGGEGCKGLSKALQLLIRHNAEVEEYEIKLEVMNRLDHQCLLSSDIESIKSSTSVSSNKYYDYIFYDTKLAKNIFGDRELNSLFPSVVPLSIIDTRILDLALNLDEHPDASLLSGYRRLEGLVREKHAEFKGLSAAKLFSKAYQGENSFLEWPDVDKSEAEGRASLFIGVFKSYRNKRSHHEQSDETGGALREFLLLNELFILESQARLKADEYGK
tara:strand:+ start:5866 stop:6753 length:888 start_codon:yes stop_codon:yes gene_type:complete